MTESKSVVLQAYGGYDKLMVEWTPIIEPEVGQVMIKIDSCGMNFADIYTRHGLFTRPVAPKPPFIMGREAAGQIVKVGQGVERLKVIWKIFHSLGGIIAFVFLSTIDCKSLQHNKLFLQWHQLNLDTENVVTCWSLQFNFA